jgi:hypothetical protein
MRIYTLTECCALLRVNPKTLHKWLAGEGIRPQASRADTRIRFLTQEQTERLSEVYDRPLQALQGGAAVESVTPGALILLIDRLDQQEKRLDRLETELRQAQECIEHLQQEMAKQTSQHADRIEQQKPESTPDGERQPKRKAKHTKSKRVRGKRLPGSLVLLRVFAEQHHVPIRVADRASKAGKIAVVRGKWLVNSRYATEALGERGQHEFYEAFHERVDFTRCDRCPHGVSISVRN